MQGSFQSSRGLSSCEIAVCSSSLFRSIAVLTRPFLPATNSWCQRLHSEFARSRRRIKSLQHARFRRRLLSRGSPRPRARCGDECHLTLVSFPPPWAGRPTAPAEHSAALVDLARIPKRCFLASNKAIHSVCGVPSHAAGRQVDGVQCRGCSAPVPG